MQDFVFSFFIYIYIKLRLAKLHKNFSLHLNKEITLHIFSNIYLENLNSRERQYYVFDSSAVNYFFASLYLYCRILDISICYSPCDL